MSALPPNRKKGTPDFYKKLSERFRRSGYLIGAVLLHLILFLLVGTLVIWKAQTPIDLNEFHGVAVKVPPPPVQPPLSGGAAANPQFEPQAVVVPVVTPLSTITTVKSNFQVDSTRVVDQALSHISDQMAQATGLDTGGGPKSGLGTNPFGTFKGTSSQFEGYFYDLKQTPGHQPTNVTEDKMISTIREFCQGGWADADLDRQFFKSPSSLYTNQILIPLQFSLVGPKAFGLEQVCQPGYWLVLYHLAGYGDDILIVRLNNDVVLDSGWQPPATRARSTRTYAPTWAPPDIQALRNMNGSQYAQTTVGDSFHLDAGDSITIDVLIGDGDLEGGAGQCGFFLYLLEDGKDYPKDATGFPIFPLFQVGPDSTVKRDGKYPPFTCNPEDALSQ
jgi:hypothetical protein